MGINRDSLSASPYADKFLLKEIIHVRVNVANILKIQKIATSTMKLHCYSV